MFNKVSVFKKTQIAMFTNMPFICIDETELSSIIFLKSYKVKLLFALINYNTIYCVFLLTKNTCNYDIGSTNKWYAGEIVEFDSASSQVNVKFKYQNQYRHYWVHLDNNKEIRWRHNIAMVNNNNKHKGKKHE